MTNINTKILLAREFGSLIQEALSRSEFQAVIDRNKNEESDSVCHSHDYLDANMYMDEAFQAVMLREIDLDSESDTELWNDAWSIAKAAGFFA
jgi:hypothetical protein